MAQCGPRIARGWSQHSGRTRRRNRSHRTAAAVALAGALILGIGTLGRAEPPRPPGYVPPVVPVQPGPPQQGHLGAVQYEKAHPGATPLGANDFGCRPGAAHPRPVILAHGTDASAYTDWAGVGPQLAQAGFCVFALDYGGKPGATHYGTEDLWISSAQIGEFVDRVLAATGARQVDLVGFSQGANVTRYYVSELGGASKVGRWVGLASPTNGGIMYGLVPLADALPGLWPVYRDLTSLAAIQQAAGSPFIRQLNEGGDTVPGVEYTTIISRVDEMIQPYRSMELRGPGARNVVLQDLCSIDLTGHFQMVYDPYVWQLLRNVLDPAHARAPECRFVPLGTGIPEVILGAHT